MISIWRRVADSRLGQGLGIGAVVSSIVLTAIHPVTFGLLPATPDGLLHLYRLVAFDHAIQHGDPWPRYLPGFLFGYGAPVFNYYAPLSLYLPEGLHLLGLRFLDALLVGMILFTLLGAFGAYLVGRSWLGPVAGIVTAAAYTYAPFVLYDWPRRGAVAEFAALALFPWALWAFWRLARLGHRRDLLAAVFFLNALILTHNITALYGLAILIVICVYLWWTSPDPRRAFVRLGLAGVLGLGITLFFWLPALAETGYVHIERVSYGVANLDFHNNFQSLLETFAPPMTADLTQLHPPVPRPLGWVQIFLAGCSAAMILWPGVLRRDEQKRLRGWLIIFSGLIVLLLFFTVRASTPLWEVIPLMHYIQFPWRLLGPISLLLAILAGMGAVLIAREIPWVAGQIAWVALCAAAMMIYALPWLYGAYVPDPPAQTIVDAQNFERQTGWLAGTAAGEYVPIWTTELPDTNRLLGLYAEGDVIPRLQPNPAVTVRDASWQAKGGTISLQAESETTLVFDWLYFPGWWAQIDGTAMEVAPTTPQGFVSVMVPPGDHTIQIGFGPTPLRLGAMIASSVFGFLAIIALIFLPTHTWPGLPSDIPRTSLPVGAILLAVGVASLLVLGGKMWLVDDAQTAFKRARFAAGIEEGLQTTILASFNHTITLLGYDLTPRPVVSGRDVHLALYWRLDGATPVEDYSSIVYLRDAEGNVLQQIGSQHPGDLPTSQWFQNSYVQERLTLTIPAGTPPGSYTLDAALYSHESERNLDVFDSAGNPTGVLANLGMLEVLRPGHPARIPMPETATSVDLGLNEFVTLRWVNGLPEEAEVGQPISVFWVWRATEQPLGDTRVQIVWRGSNGEIVATSAILPLVNGYPTSQWEKRDSWRGVHVVTVPGRLVAGEYTVGVWLVDEQGLPFGNIAHVSTMQVTTPERTFRAPRSTFSVDSVWQNQIHLTGYDVTSTRVARGDALKMMLTWQPQSDVSQNLTAFVHIVDDAGNIVAQQDQIPVLGTRPTTGWAPGEFISDTVQVYIDPGVPPGSYRVRIGWYDPITGGRILLADGAEFWLLPQGIVIN